MIDVNSVIGLRKIISFARRVRSRICAQQGWLHGCGTSAVSTGPPAQKGLHLAFNNLQPLSLNSQQFNFWICVLWVKSSGIIECVPIAWSLNSNAVSLPTTSRLPRKGSLPPTPSTPRVHQGPSWPLPPH